MIFSHGQSANEAGALFIQFIVDYQQACNEAVQQRAILSASKIHIDQRSQKLTNIDKNGGFLGQLERIINILDIVRTLAFIYLFFSLFAYSDISVF